jgi:hypothetical protein
MFFIINFLKIIIYLIYTFRYKLIFYLDHIFYQIMIFFNESLIKLMYFILYNESHK